MGELLGKTLEAWKGVVNHVSPQQSTPTFSPTNTVYPFETRACLYQECLHQHLPHHEMSAGNDPGMLSVIEL